MRHILLPAIAGLLLAGCNLAPKYVRPALPVPASTPDYSAPAAAAGAAIVPADTAWRDFFVDDRLRGLIALALDQNRDLRLAVANVEQARALYRVQRSDLLPGVAASGGATYQKSPVGGLGGGGGGAAAGAGRFDIYSASVGVSAWEIDLFGRVRNLTPSAQEQYFASEENRNAAQATLIAEVASAWITMAADQERLRIARDLERTFGMALELNRARFRAGVASELEVRQAQTSHDQARSDIAAATALVAQDQNALNLLAGTTVPADLLPAALDEREAMLDNLPADLPSEVLLRRPDIAAAEHRLRAGNADIGAARAAFFPRISLTAAFGVTSLGLSNLFQSGSESWSVAPTASLPLLDFGRNSGNLAYSKASYRALVAQYEKTVQQAFREVSDALARRATIGDQLAAQRSLADGARAGHRLSEARFRSGIDPFLTTLDAQRTLYAAEQGLLTTRLQRGLNAVELYRALGGGLR
ncbi:efflux transporter outer membrane subunit [Rhizorhabdus dicambivorans]|uniref:Transporter n=1 Tax=Rhizorhabdus dicambivorans TaxID=1850238 RepID=A0A2A4FXV5_9SPHN|nr:efflux transporter outer membrane subunit [Rhizorhabdus dicambivorans]ATE63407.1 transporter [Rhizorhabdus dicambivorans]PCE43624.1 transporter [Rhizorhabdus dicambivorans]